MTKIVHVHILYGLSMQTSMFWSSTEQYLNPNEFSSVHFTTSNISSHDCVANQQPRRSVNQSKEHVLDLPCYPSVWFLSYERSYRWSVSVCGPSAPHTMLCAYLLPGAGPHWIIPAVLHRSDTHTQIQAGDRRMDGLTLCLAFFCSIFTLLCPVVLSSCFFHLLPLRMAVLS